MCLGHGERCICTYVEIVLVLVAVIPNQSVCGQYEIDGRELLEEQESAFFHRHISEFDGLQFRTLALIGSSKVQNPVYLETWIGVHHR